MIIQEKSIPHIFRNKYLRDLGGAVMVGGSGGGTVTTVGGDYLPANLYESETYKVNYNTEFLKNLKAALNFEVVGDTILNNLTVNGDSNLKNTNIDGDINLTGTIYVNGEEFKGGSGADLETIDKIDEIEENLNILVDEYKKSGYRYSFSKAKDNWFGFTTFVAFPEKQLWNYRYNWQIKGDVHIYTKDFNAIYYVYATGDLSKDGTLTLSDSSCFAIGERRVPVVSVRLGGISYSEDHPTNPAAHVGFTFRTPLRLDVVAFSHFDLTAYNPNNAGEDWIEYPASEVDYMPLLYDTDGTSTAPDPDKDYSYSSMLNNAFIPVVKMANSLSDLGITATSDELNILDGALITTKELNSLQGIENNVLDTIDKIKESVDKILTYEIDYTTYGLNPVYFYIDDLTGNDYGLVEVDLIHDYGDAHFKFIFDGVGQYPLHSGFDIANCYANGPLLLYITNLRYMNLDVTYGVSGYDVLGFKFDDEFFNYGHPAGHPPFTQTNPLKVVIKYSGITIIAPDDLPDLTETAIKALNQIGDFGKFWWNSYTTKSQVLAMIDSAITGSEEGTPLTNYYTKEESDNKYALKSNIPDISGLATKEELNSYIKEIPSEYVTETELSEKGYLTEHQSIEHLATKEELVNYLPKGDYLTEVPVEYVKDEDLKYYFVPLLNRLDIVESALGDIELILDKIIGEDDSYLVKTLNEIIG